jgi:hypothetical protein
MSEVHGREVRRMPMRKRAVIGLSIGVVALLTLVIMIVRLGGSADAGGVGGGGAELTVQRLGPVGTIGENEGGGVTVTFRVRFDCGSAPVGTYLQVETFVVQGGADSPNVAFGATGARCKRGPQSVVATAYSDPFYPDVRFVPGRAQARATVYGCPAGTDEFCDGFIDELSQSIRLR